MTRPQALDLYCNIGGASTGLYRAGFEVTGVDIAPKERYPFSFVHMDALDYLDTQELSRFSLIFASPPCQHYSFAGQRWVKSGDREWPDLLDQTRQRLQAWAEKTDGVYIIENVKDAPLHRSVMLCGTMFGLKLLKHRYFESNLFLFQPLHAKHSGRIKGGFKDYVTVAGHGGNGSGKIADWQEAMGIDWTRDRHELAEAIPPAYTEWLGRQVIEVLQNAADSQPPP